MLKQTYNADIKHQDTGCITIQKMWIELWLKGSDSGNLFFLLVLSGDQIRSKVAMGNHYLLLFIEFIDVFPT